MLKTSLITRSVLTFSHCALISEFARGEVEVVHHALVAIGIAIGTTDFHIESVELVKVEHGMTTVQSENAPTVLLWHEQHWSLDFAPSSVISCSTVMSLVRDSHRVFIDPLLFNRCNKALPRDLRIDGVTVCRVTYGPFSTVLWQTQRWLSLWRLYLSSM